MSKLALGIIGVGYLGQIHARLASRIDEIDLVGIYDQDQARCRKVAEQFGTAAFSSSRELMRQVQAVSIVVPTEAHHQVALQALEQDCHLFIEKPMAQSVQQAREINQKAREKGRKIQVGHIERFNPAFLCLRDQDIQPLFVECHRLSRYNPRGTDVSVILDLMIHDLDIILHLMQGRPKSIQACGVSVVSEGEDIANVRLGFEGGGVANLTSSRISTKDMRKMRIFQKNCYIGIDFLEQKSQIISLDSEQKQECGPEALVLGQIGNGETSKQVILQTPPSPEVNSLQKELQEFALAVLQDKQPIVTGEEGMLALELAHTILEKIKHPEL
ncbi:MAG: Gfo/Idh/MocA family oxidoreductase [Thermodesulfobacteriota bacterium]